jgi:hypothetical protein
MPQEFKLRPGWLKADIAKAAKRTERFATVIQMGGHHPAEKKDAPPPAPKKKSGD